MWSISTAKDDMKTMIRTLAFAAMGSVLVFGSTLADTSVKGYYKKDGTYVQPHKRSDPNSSKNDNWSTKGNQNPYTGKKGTKDPNSSYKPKY
jgi:hypothetical protein